MAKRRAKGRPVHGILLLNKPAGITSNTALQKVKHLFNANKAGHTGSLDQLATGLLPICLGEATKLSSFLLEAEKYYQADCQLGIKTTTGDAEGEVLETRLVPDLTVAQVNAVLSQFTGELSQIPPMYSALKHQGQALYTLARQGKVIERQPRTITIYAIQLQDLQKDQLKISVHCSKGTYIRTLAEDIGEALGCGAHIRALHRIGVNGFFDMVELATLETMAGDMASLDALLIPLAAALPNLPTVQVSEEYAFYLRQGQALQISNAPASGWVRLLTRQEALIGIGKVLEDGRIAPKRLINQS